MKKLLSKKLWGVLMSLFAVLFAAIMILTYIAENMAFAAINMMFGTSTQKQIDDPNAEPSIFFKTKYEFEVNGKNLLAEDSAMIEEAEAAGAVLLWNKADALPLAGTEKMSLFGHTSTNLIECGSGSGYVQTFDYNANKDISLTMKEAFESRGFTVNPTLWNLYATGAASSYKYSHPGGGCPEWYSWKVNEAPWSVVNTANGSFAAYNDVAVITIGRLGGEQSDLHYNYTGTDDTVGSNAKGSGENTLENGAYLGLTDAEDGLLTNVIALKNNGTFKKVIVLLNTGNPLQMADLDVYFDGIDACMWIGQPGSTGINAVADLLKGKDMQGNPMTPSGHLSDTWAYNLNSAPSTVNDGNYIYGNTNLLTGGNLGNRANKYMVYQEGIYIGYRYYETRYADLIMEQGNADSVKGAKNSAGAWSYEEEVAFPFGYGLSYTTFEYSNFAVEKADKEYKVTVTVKNMGSVAGKEAVQVYLQKPYTDYDRDYNVEKSAVELVGYTKTKLLQPGESEKYTVSVPEESFKTYDAEGQGTYILEKGSYYLTVASDAHAAVNNILKENHAPNDEHVMGGEGRTAENKGKSVEKIDIANNDYRTYSKSTQTGYEIENQLDSGDINKYQNRGNNSVVYLSRNDWDATYPTETPKLYLNSDMVNDLRYENVPDDSEYEMPEYQVMNSTDADPETGTLRADIALGDVVAYQFIEAPLYPERSDSQDIYDDGLGYAEHWEKMWNQLLDEMSFEEQAKMIVDAFHWIHGAVSIAMPESRQENGPVGITKRQEAYFSLPNDDTIKGTNGTGWTWVAYPCAGILAASFDSDIGRRVGEHKSEDMLYLGYNGIYAPGVNMHRSPYGGRAFEYPSEDPYLAGMSAAYETMGIESQGCMAYAKHYALNDTEVNRRHVGVWSNEQASREIYLRAFELVFTVGGASATMNAFNRIGTRWSGGCYALMTTILRDEWGYDGLVISDWRDNDVMNYVDGVLAGTDCFDGNGSASVLIKYKDNAAIAQAMRLAAKRMIYNVVRTNVMNGTSITTKYISVTPWWQETLHISGMVFGGLTGLSVLMFVVSLASNGGRSKDDPELAQAEAKKVGKKAKKQAVKAAKAEKKAAIRALPKEEKPLGFFGWLGLTIFYSIPVIGWIPMLTTAFKGKNKARKMHAMSYFVLFVLVLIAAGVFAVDQFVLSGQLFGKIL